MQIQNVIEFPDVPILKHDRKETIKALKNGDIKEVRVSSKKPVDYIVNYGLDEGILQEGLKEFPDPRKIFEVPIEVLLLPQIIQRLDNEHSLVSAPYMLNCAELITKLGYSAEVLSDGFNNRNLYPRDAPFHGETLKHVLLSTRPEDIVTWFNETWSSLLEKHSPGKTGQYIMDGMKIHIPKHLCEKFQGAGVVKNSNGEYEYGYKVVWIYEVIDRKGVIRGVKFGPINDHDLKLGRELVNNFNFSRNALLVMDRGFFDSAWITSLKKDRGIDVCIPLKRNMELHDLAVWNKLHGKEWKDHPSREGQNIRDLAEDELSSDSCPVWGSGVLVNFKKKNGEDEFIVIMDTRKGVSGETLLETYDLRSEIEEAHRQMKLFQGLETLPSKKYVQVIFRVIMGLVGYNLFNLFLNSEGCANFKDFTLKIFRQRRSIEEGNPEIIIYTDMTFTTMKTFRFMQLILGLKDQVQEKLRGLFEELSIMSEGAFFGPEP